MFGRLLPTVALLLLGATVLAAAASGGPRQEAAYGPVIGKPTTVPIAPLAGKAFVAVFKVTRSDTGRPLMVGTMAGVSSVGGKLLPHTESFRAGTARVSLQLPSSSAGKVLTIKLTIRAVGKSATRVSVFHVAARSEPSLSIADASVVEGNSGTTTLQFAVRLSASSSRVVSVSYATSDGTASAPGDYAAATGTLTFQPGERTKTIAVTVVGDTLLEPDETLSVIVSAPVNAKISRGSATGTITNDDTSVAVTPGNYQGATANGDYVFLTVLPNRSVTGFRVNNVTESCSPEATLGGVIDWTNNTWSIAPDASFRAEGSWSGSNVQGDTEYTKWSAKVTGVFSGTSVTGKLSISDELNYRGTHYVCSVVDKSWSATLKP
jgi:Calx-beta domain